MLTSPYTRADIMRLDCLTFLRILKECEERERKAVERLKSKEENG